MDSPAVPQKRKSDELRVLAPDAKKQRASSAPDTEEKTELEASSTRTQGDRSASHMPGKAPLDADADEAAADGASAVKAKADTVEERVAADEVPAKEEEGVPETIVAIGELARVPSPAVEALT